MTLFTGFDYLLRSTNHIGIDHDEGDAWSRQQHHHRSRFATSTHLSRRRSGEIVDPVSGIAVLHPFPCASHGGQNPSPSSTKRPRGALSPFQMS